MSQQGQAPLAPGSSMQTDASGQVRTNAGPTSANLSGDVTLPSSAAVTAQEADPNRPAWLPIGYDSPEAFREAVDKGEYKPGTIPTTQAAPATDGTQPPATDTTTQTPPVPGAELPPEIAAKMEPFTTEFTKTGTLTPESKKAAAAAFGVPEAFVDTYMAGFKANTTAAEQPFYAAAGGQEQYAAFQGWAAKGGLTKPEMDAYNEALDKAPGTAKFMLDQFMGKFRASGNAPQPRDVTTRSATTGAADAGDTYGSMAQVVKDMDDPRYRADPAYRAAVENKIKRSGNMA